MSRTHRSKLSRVLALLTLGGFVIAATPAARATVYVPISDAALADRAPVIVEAQVLAIEPAPGERIATDYLVEVERSIKESLPGDSLIVRLPGGVRADGIGFLVRGTPRFTEGEKVLLFLEPRDDGTFGLHQFLLGAFHLSPSSGAPRVAWRNLEGARRISPAGTAPADGLRDLERFRGWLEDRARGLKTAADYFLPVAADDTASVPAKFATLITSDAPPPLGCGASGGHSVRWFDFGFGQEIGWRTHFSGQDGLPGSGIEELRTALDAWTDDPNTPILYGFEGITGAASGFTGADGSNTVLFGDPNDEIGGSFDGAGLLAIGGPWFDCQALGHEGELFHPVIEGDIITQDGLELFFAATPDPSRAAEQLFAHELGHTLGLAHSQDPEALMLAEYHPDQRGASLDVDDLAGIYYLYGPRENTSPPSGGLVPPAEPSNLAATLTAENEVRLEWSDDSGNESNFRIERRQAGDFALMRTVANNTTSFVDETVQPEASYGYRVRAQNGAGASPYSNEAEIETPVDARPAAPSNLRVAPLSSTAVRLTWQDNADDETAFVIEIRVGGVWADIPLRLDADTDKVIIEELTPGTNFSFRVRAINFFGDSETSNPVKVTTFANDDACVVTGDQLCLVGGRFRVTVDFRNQYNDGVEGSGVAVPSTDESGLFWFFGPENIELIVKALDGRSFNDYFWVFYGALSDVEFWVNITDTVTGEVEIYHNPPGEICGLADTTAFPDEGLELPVLATSSATEARSAMSAETTPALDVEGLTLLPDASLETSAPAATTGETGTCLPGPETLCLLDKRMRVSVRWRNQYDDGREGDGRAVTDTDNSGFFWFFNIENTEMVIKALDGSGFNGHIWIYFGALTDLEYWITIEDTVAGTSRVYYNPPGEVCGRGDTLAFPVDLPDDPVD